MADNIFTQEELNAKIAEEKRRIQAKADERVKLELAEAQAKLEAEKQKALEEATAKTLQAEARALKAEVAGKYKLDDDLKEFLTATTEEELTKQAEKLASKFNATIPAKKAEPKKEDEASRFRTTKGIRKVNNGD